MEFSEEEIVKVWAERSFKECNPFLEYFRNVAKQHYFIFREEEIVNSSYCYITQPETKVINQNETYSDNDLSDQLYKQVNLSYNKIQLIPLITTIANSHEFLRTWKLSDINIFKSDYKNLKQGINKSIYDKFKITITNIDQPTIFMNKPEIMISPAFDRLVTYISIRQNLGIAVNKEFINKLKESSCSYCSKRLKCALVTQEDCNIAWLVN